MGGGWSTVPVIDLYLPEMVIVGYQVDEVYTAKFIGI
jgi:hypothetical protein